MPESPPPLETRLAIPSKSHANYVALARELRDANDLSLSPFRAAFLSTFSIELMEPHFTVELAAQGFRLDPFFSPFNQFEQLVLAPASDLYRFEPEVITLALRPEDWLAGRLGRFTGTGEADRSSVRESIVDRLENLITGIRKNSSAPIFLWNMAEPARLAAGIADASLEFSEQQFIAEVNQGIAGLCRRNQNTWVFDFHRASCEFGLKNFYDLRLNYVARMPFSQGAQAHLARNHARCLALLKRRPKKCLVLDLDNTLWGGVVGEDGPNGIELGEDYPGSAYLDFQRYLACLRSRGILLAIASKNNEKDALDALAGHPSSILRPEDFSELQIHWEDKASSIRNIAANLNIALDSITFFDDNPAEREWVKSQLPDVHVFETGTSPMNYIDVIESSGLFDTLILTPEDMERAELYRIERQRRISSRSFENPEEFLRSLDTIITHELLDPESPKFRRVLQLLGRTNQFNLTTRRHSGDELQRLLETGGIGVNISVSDRFGNHGLVGFALAVPPSGHDSKEEWRIDTFLLSCRVMGRRIESALLRLLVDRVRERASDVAIIGEYIPTSKNGPSRNFYLEHAFEKIDESSTKVRYLLDSSRLPALPDLYSLKAQ